jgi:hypothetical protein
MHSKRWVVAICNPQAQQLVSLRLHCSRHATSSNCAAAITQHLMGPPAVLWRLLLTAVNGQAALENLPGSLLGCSGDLDHEWDLDQPYGEYAGLGHDGGRRSSAVLSVHPGPPEHWHVHVLRWHHTPASAQPLSSPDDSLQVAAHPFSPSEESVIQQGWPTNPHEQVPLTQTFPNEAAVLQACKAHRTVGKLVGGVDSGRQHAEKCKQV